MRLCSVTIMRDTESNEADAAIESALPLVDACLRVKAGEITDFSAARNAALQEAADLDYDWALMLDTDERIHDHERIMKTWDRLEDTTHDMLHVWAHDHSYAKPRFFRLPARGHYTGGTHECWVSDPGSTTGTLEGITFSELPKTEAQYRAKAERDREILEKYTQDHPDDPRWWYYLGDTYSGLGDDAKALDAFARCYFRNGWDEESAWACYRQAEILCKENDYQMALAWCCNGMRRHPGMAELPWLAGYCCFKMGRFQHAIWWEEMAIALNDAEAHTHRINFRHEPALHEGPFDVVRYAYEQLGDKESGEQATEFFELELEARLDKSRAT